MGLSFYRDSLPLQNNEVEAIRNLHHVGSSKLFIRTKTKFWLARKGNLLKGEGAKLLPLFEASRRGVKAIAMAIEL